MGRSLKGKNLGEGITERKDGRFEGKFTDKTGKRKCVYGKTVAEVKSKLLKAKVEDASNNSHSNKTLTLNEWYAEWISTYCNRLRSSTLEVYDDDYNLVKEQLGDMKLLDIKQVTIQKVLNGLKSDCSRHRAKVILSMMFTKAVRNDLVTRNPVLDVVTSIDGTKPKIKNVLTTQQAETFIELASKRLYVGEIITIAINTGMRISEILALRFEDIDYANNVIHVRQTLSRKVGVINQPKSNAGIRDIPMVDAVKDAIKIRQEKNKLIQEAHPESNLAEVYVFVSRNNSLITYGDAALSISRVVKAIQKTDKTFPHVTAHSLRHSFATYCAERGMTLKTLQTIMGHSNYSTTANIYYHSRDEKMQEEMKSIIGNGVSSSCRQRQ